MNIYFETVMCKALYNFGHSPPYIVLFAHYIKIGHEYHTISFYRLFTYKQRIMIMLNGIIFFMRFGARSKWYSNQKVVYKPRKKLENQMIE
ncbi:hypothetical protein D3C87_1777890 [compost metagenome]